jgi:hypothetical protein
MQRLEVSCAVRHIYIYIVSRLRVKLFEVSHIRSLIRHPRFYTIFMSRGYPHQASQNLSHTARHSSVSTDTN